MRGSFGNVPSGPPVPPVRAALQPRGPARLGVFRQWLSKVRYFGDSDQAEKHTSGRAVLLVFLYEGTGGWVGRGLGHRNRIHSLAPASSGLEPSLLN